MTKPSLALVVLLTGLVACSTDPKVKAEKFLARGDAYVAQHKYRDAIIEYRNAVKAQPARADVHYKLAQAYTAAGEPVRAYGAYRTPPIWTPRTSMRSSNRARCC